MFRQQDNLQSRSVGDHLKRTVTALLLTRYEEIFLGKFSILLFYHLRCLQLSGWFPEHLQSADELTHPEVVRVASIVTKHIQSCSCNAYEINEFIRRGHSLIDCQNVELGGAVYPSISLSNHSCAANTSRTNYGRYGVVHAIKTINKDEKVFDNYGYFYHTDPKEKRQEILAAQYFFPCNCQACKQNWPSYRELSRREAEFCCYVCGYPIGDRLSKVIMASLYIWFLIHFTRFKRFTD